MDFDSLQDDSQAAPAAASSAAPMGTPVSAPVAPTSAFDALPDERAPVAPVGKSFDELVDDNAKYQTGPQQALAGIEGALRGGSLGLSDWAETKLAGVSPEEIRGRRDANPWTSGLANVGGAMGLGMLTGGGSLAAEAMGGTALAGAAGFGLEGAVFGAGAANSEAALGDPDLNAQKVMAHIGFGGLFGAGLGAIAGKLGAFAGKAGDAAASAAEDVATELHPDGPILTGYDAPKSTTPLRSFADLKARNQVLQTKGLSFELPQKKVLVRVLSELPDLEAPVIPQQIEALNSKGALDDYRIAYREGDSPVAREMQNYEGSQKAELVRKTDQTIESLSPGVAPATEAAQGGARATEAFTEQYQQEKKALGPLFQALDKVDLGALRADIVPLMETLANKIPSVARMFDYGEDGILKEILPYDPKWGLSEAAYNAVKRVFRSLEDGAEDPASFQDLMNLRGSMDAHIDKLASDQGPSQIRGLKAAFMDYLQNVADEHISDLNIREAFKRYAINEQNREVIQRAFGSSVGGQDLSFMPKNPAEDILGKIFRNTETVKAAKRILSPQKFDELLASHLNVVRGNLTKNGVFSSNRFLTYLKSHSAELAEAFSHRPDILARLKNLTTVSTIIPDMASVNPSGSAKTGVGLIKNMLKDMSVGELGLGVLNPKILLGILGKRTFDILKESHAERAAIAEFNAGLAGKSLQQHSLVTTQKILNSVGANLDRAAKSIFSLEQNEQTR